MFVYYMNCICKKKKKKKKKNLPLLEASVKLYSWANPELDQTGKKKGKRNVQEVSQSQTAALPRH